jgi:hypothetical protein
VATSACGKRTIFEHLIACRLSDEHQQDLKNSLWAASNIRKPSVHLCDMHLLPMTSLSTEEFEQRSAHPTESTASTTNTESQRQQPDLLMWQFFSSPEDELREVVQYIYSFVKSMLSMFPEEVECILAPSKRQEQAGSENLVLQQVLRSAVELTSETNTLYRKVEILIAADRIHNDVAAAGHVPILRDVLDSIQDGDFAIQANGSSAFKRAALTPPVQIFDRTTLERFLCGCCRESYGHWWHAR